jgi:hypothetical protein
MHSLFTTELSINGEMVPYEVVFENECYKFKPAQNSNGEEIILKREEDEWHAVNNMDAGTKTAALSALELYLLSQH